MREFLNHSPFVASSMLNYFLPPGLISSILVRVIIMFTFFSAAYIAEAIRGGIQAIPKGQYEAADALGMISIGKKQGLQHSCKFLNLLFLNPEYFHWSLQRYASCGDWFVRSFGIGRAAPKDTKWNGLSTETYLFVALFFFVSCFCCVKTSSH